MPNPKTGTVTATCARRCTDIKAGKVEFRVDKAGNIHAPVGKLSFGAQKLEENARRADRRGAAAKPAAAKGKYVKSAHLSSTMGPGVSLDPR